jgi:ribosomal protein S12 methylthiotransferase
MMLGRLRERGWEITGDPDAAEVIVVNTCSFIESAANESIDTILSLATCKQTGVCRRLIVTGCLPERYRAEIVASLPEVDLFLGTGAYDMIEKGVEDLLGTENCLLPDPNRTELVNAPFPRMITEPQSAYLKIAEGCNSRCTYCIIPKLRGNHRSRTMADITAEARKLIDAGVREIVLVAQDTTNYGRDLLPPSDLNHLLLQLSDLSENIWIRFLYGHPNRLDAALIKTVASRPNICSYFDIPIQHASDSLLQRMGRRYSRDDLYRVFDTLRTLAPEASLRTTAIVGFPGETDADVETLIAFMEKIRFDHLGVFTYSDADDLPSHGLSGHVSKKVAEARLAQVMGRQLEISRENNEKHLGRTLTVLVEESPEENIFIGRHSGQAPEVDGITYVHVKPAHSMVTTGSFTRVRIIDTLEYDLVGEAIDPI